MDRTIDRTHNGMNCLQILWLTALATLALQLALAYPTQRRDAAPASGRDYAFYFQAHQLFQRDPEELNEQQSDDLERWCRCLQLVGRHEFSGVQSLADAECRFVVQVLDDLWSRQPSIRRLTDDLRIVSAEPRPSTSGGDERFPDHRLPRLRRLKDAEHRFGEEPMCGRTWRE